MAPAADPSPTATTRPTEAVLLVEAGDLAAAVAGTPLAVRNALVLQRAGIERLTVVGPALPADPRVRIPVRRADTLAPAPDDAPRLVVGPGTVVDEPLVRDLLGRGVLHVACAGAWVAIVPGRLLGARRQDPVPPRAGTLAPVAAGPAALERALLLGLQNAKDGYLDRLVHRRFSRPLTRVLLRTPLTPNAVTAMGIVLGVAGGLVLGWPAPAATLAGLLLLLLSGVLDCCDGELARLRFGESRFGHALDVTGDTLVHVALFAGIAVRLARTATVPGWPVLATLGVGVLAAFAVISWSDATEHRRRPAGGWENRLLAGVLSPLTTRDWYVFPLAFAIAGRLDWLVPAAAVGAHAFWLLTLGVLLRALRRARRG